MDRFDADPGTHTLHGRKAGVIRAVLEARNALSGRASKGKGSMRTWFLAGPTEPQRS